jgi:hypothetical protein
MRSFEYVRTKTSAIANDAIPKVSAARSQKVTPLAYNLVFAKYVKLIK